MLGEFDFSDAKLQGTIGVLPPKSTRLHRGVTSTCSENMISQKKSSVIPSISFHPKKHRSERAKTGRKNIVKTVVDQITSTIPVADFEPLCRRTPNPAALDAATAQSTIVPVSHIHTVAAGRSYRWRALDLGLSKITVLEITKRRRESP